MDTGEVVYAKNADAKRPIASTGKIFVAMVVRKRGIRLDAVTEITLADKRHGSGGAKSKLLVGLRVTNLDLLRAMLVASDNRAATALGRAVGLGPAELVGEMNALARSIGLSETSFVGPSGLRENESTAREMATALMVALRDPVLADIMTMRQALVQTLPPRPRQIHYGNTNRVLHKPRYTVFGGKTGYTSAAGYCLIVAAKVGTRKLVVSLFGSHGKLTRYGDFGRIASWVEKR